MAVDEQDAKVNPNIALLEEFIKCRGELVMFLEQAARALEAGELTMMCEYCQNVLDTMKAYETWQ